MKFLLPLLALTSVASAQTTPFLPPQLRSKGGSKALPPKANSWQYDLTLDDPCIKSHGSFLGAGGIMVFDDTRDMVKAAHDAMAFFAHESCGKCFPCRIGTQRLTERLNGESNDLSQEAWAEEVNDIGEAMKATSACGLGMAAPNVTDSFQKYFPEQVAAATNRQAALPPTA